MAFSFTIERPQNLESTLHNVKAECEKQKGYLLGDTERGRISSSGVEGTYSVGEKMVTITITRQPPFVPNFLIEAEVRSIFRNVKA